MKTFTTVFRVNSLAFLTLISIVWIPCASFGIEPISTIGQPYPEEHAFLDNHTILRVVPTHIQVVNVNTGKVLDEFGKRTDISHVRFSPRMTHLAILNFSQDTRTTTINIWDIDARQLISQWEIDARIFEEDTAFSPTQPIFATAIAREIHLWNWQNGETIGKLIREGLPSDKAMVFSKDGHHLIVDVNNSTLELWNIETHSLEGQFEGETVSSAGELVISPDGKTIAMYRLNSGSFYAWDSNAQQMLWHKGGGTGHVVAIAFSPDSRHLYVANRTGPLQGDGKGGWRGWDDQVRIWDVKSGQLIDTFGSEFRSFKSMILSPDGKTAILHYQDAVVLWDVKKRKQLKVWTNYISGWENALTPDGRTLVSVSRYAIKAWDISTQQMRLFASSENSLFREFAISPDGRKLAVGRDPWIEVRDLQTGNVVIQFQYGYGHSDVAFSSTGKWVAVRGSRHVRLYNVHNPAEIQHVSTGEAPNVNLGSHFIFSENDKYLAATAGISRNHIREYWILLWKREGDTFHFQYAWQVPELRSSSHSRPTFISNEDDSTVLAVNSIDAIQIWRLDPNLPQLLKSSERGLYLHFSPDGQHLFTEKDDNLQILDWQADVQIDHPTISNFFDLSKNGTVLASYNDSGQIHIWDATQLLPFQPQPTAVEPKGKQFVTLGEIKRNQLLQNFPNPFNPETWIPFRLADKSHVTIRIYTSTGKLVRSLSPGIMSAGDYSSHSQAVHWDGRNDAGEPVSSGVYLYTINAGDFSATRKMLIQK
ncbi:MAG: T9SS type A sorting domain-containing protein [Candidatus Poribacteria bacterium]|nr:T9SS type A sorting domain-containing protein [Candidatus Poribacteria bacterium]